MEPGMRVILKPWPQKSTVSRRREVKKEASGPEKQEK
jgi:hypothetical protein